MLVILIGILLTIHQSHSNIKELNSVKWSEIGLRNVCPLDEYNAQMQSIKHEFKNCLHFKHILLDGDVNSVVDFASLNMDPNDLEEIEEEHEIQKHFTAITYSKNKLMNPFCKLAKHWTNCIKYILPLNCLESNVKSLVPVYLPRTVQEQLRRLYDKHAKQLRMMRSPDNWERYPHSGDHELIKFEEELRQKYHIRMRQVKFEQLTDYYKFRCDQRVQLHIDSLDMQIDKIPGAPPAIDRFQEEAFADIF